MLKSTSRLNLILIALALTLPANALDLLGEQVRFQATYPTADTAYITSVVTVVNPGVEINCASPTATGPGCGININQGGYAIDFQANHIVFTTNASFGNRYGSGVCNCLRFTLLNPKLIFTNATLANSNVPGLDATRVTFTDTTVTLNIGGLDAPATQSTDIAVQVTDPTLPFTASPTSLTFDSYVNGPVDRSAIEIGALRPGQAFTVSTVGTWLKASATSNKAPAIIFVEADPTGLLPNNINPGSILINAPGAIPSQISIPVTFGVGSAKPAALTVSPVSLSIDITAGTNSHTSCFQIYNGGSGTIGPLQLSTTTTDAVQLVVNPTSATVGPTNAATAKSTFCVKATTTDAATHKGSVVVRSVNGTTLATLPIVQQTVPSQIGVYPRSIYIPLPPDGPDPFNLVEHPTILKTLTLTKDTIGLQGFRATGTQGWLSANPSSGSFDTLSRSLGLEVKLRAVSAGGYYGNLVVENDAHRTNKVIVVLDVSDSPTGEVEFGDDRILIPSKAQTFSTRFTPHTAAVTPIQATADYHGGPAFFTFIQKPDEGAAFNRVVPFQINLAAPLPPPGVYAGSLVLTIGTRIIQNTVVAIIPPGSAGNLAAVRAAEACTPKRIVPVITSPYDNATVKTGWPAQVAVTAVDDCANLDNADSVVATFSNGDPALTLTPITNGNWAATWIPQNPKEHVQITVTATSKDGKLSESSSTVGSVIANTLNPPTIFDGGVLNGASFAIGDSLSPGSFVSIFGRGLADAQASAPSVPLSNTLAGASVLINGQNAPVFFASDGQVNAIIPYGLPVDVPLEVVAKRGDAEAFARSVPFTAAAPGIFSYGDQLGIVVGVAANGTQALANSVAPVTAQQTIVVYATGLGEVSPAVPAGTQTPLATLSRTVATVTMAIGGIPARVDFAGLTPGSTGLYQINAVVPAGVATGDRVPVILKAAGQSSAPAYISVR